jgi:hypothetical protein
MGSFRKVTATALIGTLLSLGAPAAVRAQSPEPERREPATKEPELPVSLERIRRELSQQARTSESRDGLRLSYYVEVYGRAPRLELFSPEENLTSAPVQYGGMTHQEFLRVVTPEEFRSPAADIPGAIAAFLKWAAEKRKSAPQGDK